MVEHIVKPGECMASIAYLYGFNDPSFLYEHQANAQLRKVRQNMHTLLPNDVVQIPPRENKSIVIQPGLSVPLIVKGKLAGLKIRIKEFGGDALLHKDFDVEAAHLKYSGNTGSNGEISLMVNASLTSAKLMIFLDPQKRSALHWQLSLGALAPKDTLSGVQARLNNLGFHCANELGVLEDTTTKAIAAFKRKNEIDEEQDSSKLSTRFIQALEKAHGC